MITRKDIKPLIVGYDENGFAIVLCFENIFAPSDCYHKRSAEELAEILNNRYHWQMTGEGLTYLMQLAGYKVKEGRIRCKVRRSEDVPEYLWGIGTKE